MSAFGYRGPSIDHGLLSPSGRASKRARVYLEADYAKRAQAWFDEKHPPPSAEDVARKATAERVASLKASAANLRALADRGMCVRKYRKEAARLEAEAESLGSQEGGAA